MLSLTHAHARAIPLCSLAITSVTGTLPVQRAARPPRSFTHTLKELDLQEVYNILYLVVELYVTYQSTNNYLARSIRYVHISAQISELSTC